MLVAISMSRGRTIEWVWCLVVLMMALPVGAQERVRCVSYNVENLFDCSDDSLTSDEAFLPTALRHWTRSRYWDKQHAIARVLTTIGGDRAPDLVALCEVENDTVIHDLVHRSPLRSVGYHYAMTTSDDPRGIDVALLYKPTTFRPFAVKSICLPKEHIPEGRTVRDVLCVSGVLVSADTLDIFVCHLPSRLNGRQSEALRRKVAECMRQAIDSVVGCRVVPHVMVMGDFNDTPRGKALMPLTDEGGLACVTGALEGSYRYKGHWEQIDHVYLSPALCDEGHPLHLSARGAWVALHDFLVEPDIFYGGVRPYRTYNGMRYVGGTSDHLPVCFDLEFMWSE